MTRADQQRAIGIIIAGAREGTSPMPDDKDGIVIIRASEITMRPPPNRRVQRVAIADNAVHCRGEELGEIWWRGAQWAVTAHGIEALDGTYPIEKHRLLEKPAHLWPEHMAGKTWVDVDEFTTAWMVGLVLHGYGKRINPEQVREMFAKLPPQH
jgi:hypothetical protein